MAWVRGRRLAGDFLPPAQSLVLLGPARQLRREAGLALPLLVLALALRFPDVVLVPAWIDNVQRVMPKGEVVPVPILCSVTFGAPVQLQPDEDRHAFLARARDAVIALREV